MFVLLHELGHAIGVIAFSKSYARIFIGKVSSQNKENFKIGRLHFHLNWSYSGFCSWDRENTKNQKILALVGGPLFSLLATILFGLLMGGVPPGIMHDVFQAMMIVNMVIFLTSAIPFTYPKWWDPQLGGSPTDGLKIWKIVKGELN